MYFTKIKKHLIEFVNHDQVHNIFDNLKTTDFISQFHYKLQSLNDATQDKMLEQAQALEQETIIFYSVLAERIGKEDIKNEIQDSYFKVIAPETRNLILHQLASIYKTSNNCLIEDISTAFLAILHNELSYVKIYGRLKTPYSIWLKMRKKNIALEQISDIIAFRIIVGTVHECYKALQIIHSCYLAIPNSFKDFIYNPKHNGYKSLHTVVIGPLQQKIEIQIRTKEMEEIAKVGSAAHWLYKQQLLKSKL